MFDESDEDVATRSRRERRGKPFYLDTEHARWLCSYCRHYGFCDTCATWATPMCSLLEGIQEDIRKTFEGRGY